MTDRDLTQLLKGWLDFNDRERGAANCRWLSWYLKEIPPCGAEDFTRLLTDNLEKHAALFQSGIQLSKIVEEFRFEREKALKLGASSNDLHIAFNISALFSLLGIAYEAEKAAEDILVSLDGAATATLRKYLTLAGNQVDELCDYVRQIADAVHRIQPAGKRVALIDLPIGNTVPTLLLQNILQNDYPILLVRASLSRSDASTKGITRGELLGKKVAEAALSNGELVVYFDEWNSGVNFNKVCGLLATYLDKSVQLLPTAVLTRESGKEERYLYFCEQHDKLVPAAVGGGEQFRHILPRLNSRVPIPNYFFWAEKDRLAGFRKLQIHGSTFSTLDETIQKLNSEQSVLEEAVRICLGMAAQRRKLPPSRTSPIEITKRIFREAHADFQRCRQELEKCAEAQASGGETPDGESLFRELGDTYGAVVNGRPAAKAIAIASIYLSRRGSLDPADRFRFKHHAPFLLRLDGRMRLPHQVTMDFLNSRLMSRL